MKNKLKKLLIIKANDPAICTRKKAIIDLLNINKNYENVAKFINDPNIESLNVKYDVNEILDKLKKSETYDEFSNLISEFNLPISKIDDSLLKKSFHDNKNTVFKKIQSVAAILNKRFVKFNIEANKNRYQNNIETLFLGCYFLYGKDTMDNIILSPLICYPIEINVNTNSDNITIKKQYPVINEILCQHIRNIYGIDIEYIFNNENADIKTTINNLVKTLSQVSTIEFDAKNYNPFKLDKFYNLEDVETNNYKILNFACIQLINPSGGCIKKDVEEMIEKGVENPFEINNNINWKDKYENQIIRDDNIYEISNILNIYQKYAIKSALSENTLIIGPPGTGKSEVIATIIANAIENKKRILMSSEKAAALEVLRDRLQSLSSLCLFIYNSRDKQEFYQCLRNMREMLINNSNSSKLLIDVNCNEYEELKNLIEIYEDINSEFGDSILDIFESYNKINKEKYNDLNNKNILSRIEEFSLKNNLDYKELETFIKNINEIIKEDINLFNELIYSEFNLYDKESIEKILSSEDLMENNIFFWTLINKNKILTKISFLDKLFKKSTNVDKNKFFNYLSKLKNVQNFDKLTKNDLILFHNLNDVKNISDILVWYKFDRFLEKNNFNNYDSLDSMFKHYINKKQEIAKNNDQKILDNYMNYLRSKYQSLDIKQQRLIIECLGKADLKRLHDVNKLISIYYNVFEFLFPIWICSPEKTCVLTPLKENIFDYGIFDEASQMFVENSYPLVYRCKINVVSGDPNQMPPSDWFIAKTFDDEDELDLNAEASDSLLEKAETCGWPKFNLINHYRSRYADLISFSNEYIYDNKLEFSNRNGFPGSGIEVFNVNGIWENRYNLKEIDKIIQIIQQRFEYYKDKKIIILTFNITQSEAFENEFSNRFIGTNIYDNYVNGQIIIRNLENIQGDEADIVIMSVGYGKNNQGKIYQNFGAVSKENGFKRLNVAATRAREKMIIVKSINAEDIHTIDNENTNIFKYFINYVDRISRIKNFDEEIDLNSNEIIFDSNFEEDVYTKLLPIIKKRKKYKLITQYPVGKKRIDIVIYDVENHNVKLGIEIDGIRYHSGVKKRLEDLDRQYFLESLGYNIFRVTELEWNMDYKKVIEQIVDLI